MNNKSLAPLIVSFAAIILLTFVVINSRSLKEGVDDNNHGLEIKDKLSLGINTKRKTRGTRRILLDGGVVSQYSADTAFLLDKAKRNLVNDKISEAEDALKTVLVLDPENKTALSLLAGVFFRTGRYKESENLFRRLAALDKFENPLSLNKLASALAKMGKLSEAVELCIKAQELDPNLAEAYVNASAIFTAMGEKEKAITNMQKAYELIKHGILAYSIDPVFDNLRDFPEFQEIISKAKQDIEKTGNTDTAPEKR